ncbi:MAG: hypothetical protein QOI31_102 [Solirubrobacterales bacterium]|nr:hypothetical protein [Solirubrobacterales bacterium]
MAIVWGHRELGAVVALVVLATAAPAAANTFEVTEPDDSAPGNCSNNDCTLREAILAANDRAGNDTVILDSGTTHVLEIGGSGEDEGLTGDLDVTDRIVLEASGGAQATIDGNDLDRVLDFHARGTIENLKITGGLLSAGARGAGINSPDDQVDVSDSTLTDNHGVTAVGAYILGGGSLVDTTISDNIGTSNAGGAWVWGEPGDEFLIEGSKFVRNAAPFGPGGLTARDAAIKDTTIKKNDATGGCGGLSVSDVTVRDTQVKKNDGGFAAVCTSGAGATLDLIDSVVSNNESTGDGGGLTMSLGNGSIKRSTVAGNIASGDGGGVFAPTTQPLLIEESTISGNEAGDDGGGIYASNFTGLTLTNSTVAMNTSAGSGGGIHAENPSGGGATHVSLVFSTVAFNQAVTGGGISSVAPASYEAQGALVAANPADDLGTQDCSADITSNGRNLVSDDSGCNAFDASTDLVEDPPGLNPLDNNGGPTKTVELERTSPAVDAGGENCPNKDQRGESRPGGPKCDIGAFER